MFTNRMKLSLSRLNDYQTEYTRLNLLTHLVSSPVLPDELAVRVADQSSPSLKRVSKARYAHLF